MTYYIEQDGKIMLFDDSRLNLEAQILMQHPQYRELEIKETAQPIIKYGSGFYFADDPEYITLKKIEYIEELKQELNNIDLRSIRAIRAGETEYIKQFEGHAKLVREELQKQLNDPILSPVEQN